MCVFFGGIGVLLLRGAYDLARCLSLRVIVQAQQSALDGFLWPAGHARLFSTEYLSVCKLGLMDSSLKRTTLAEQLADKLEFLVRAGEWKGRLPGTRALAKYFEVHRDTVEAAVELLEAKGVLAPAEPRRARRILVRFSAAHAGSASGKKRLLLIQSGMYAIDSDDLDVLKGMERVWREKCGEVIWERVDYLAAKDPEKRLGVLVKRYAPDAILIQGPPSAWSHCAGNFLPTYCCGGTLIEGEIGTLSGYSTYDQLRSVLAKLVKMGHERILVPTVIPKGDFAKVIEQALRAELPGPPEQGTYKDLCPSCPEIRPEVWFEFCKRELNRVRPTAVVLTTTKYLLSLFSYCLQNRISIPHDLSVILLGYDEQLEWLNPRPVMMRYPNNKAIKHFEKWVDKGLKPLGIKFFDLDILPGSSVAVPSRM